MLATEGSTERRLLQIHSTPHAKAAHQANLILFSRVFSHPLVFSRIFSRCLSLFPACGLNPMGYVDQAGGYRLRAIITLRPQASLSHGF
jgi:hypothetical protein